MVPSMYPNESGSAPEPSCRVPGKRKTRRILEAKAASFAAKRGNDQEIAELGACLEAMARFINDIDGFIEADVAFHELIAQMSRNLVLGRIVSSILGVVAENMMKTVLERTMVTQQALAQHMEILEAIKNRDADLAAVKMHEHLELVDWESVMYSGNPAASGEKGQKGIQPADLAAHTN